MADEITVDVFWDLLQQSGLVPDAQFVALKTELSQDGKRPENARALAEELVRRGVLTDWQMDMLLQGKHRGFQLGPYRILRPLGQGGMSKVFLGEHEMMHRRSAIKVLPSKYQEDPDLLKRFQHEACAIAALDHPHIVRAYDFNKDVRYDKEIHYLVMEYVEGQDLRRMVEEQGPLEYRKAADFIAQAAEGLAHAHTAGFVHRDIKPANLLVDPNGVLKILDLGLARSTFEGQRAWETPEEGQSAVGTADYVAPEQVMDSRSVDGRADIYSLGLTFYYVLTGRRPFPKSTLVELLMAHRVEKPEAIAMFRPDVPIELVNIIDRMTAKSPATRFQKAADVADALHQWLQEAGNSQYSRISALMAAAMQAKQTTTASKEADAKAEAALIDNVLDDDDKKSPSSKPGSSSKLGSSKKLGSSSKLSGSSKLSSSARLRAAGNARGGKNGSSVELGAPGKSGSSIHRNPLKAVPLDKENKEPVVAVSANSAQAALAKPMVNGQPVATPLPLGEPDLLSAALSTEQPLTPIAPLQPVNHGAETSGMKMAWFWGVLLALVGVGTLLAAIVALTQGEKTPTQQPVVVSPPPPPPLKSPTPPPVQPQPVELVKKPVEPPKPPVKPKPPTQKPQPQKNSPQPTPQPAPPKPTVVASASKPPEKKPADAKPDPAKLLAGLTKLSFKFQSSDKNMNSPFNKTIGQKVLEAMSEAGLSPDEKAPDVMQIQVATADKGSTRSIVITAKMICTSPNGPIAVWEQSKPIASFDMHHSRADIVLKQVRQGAGKFFDAFRGEVQHARAKYKSK